MKSYMRIRAAVRPVVVFGQAVTVRGVLVWRVRVVSAIVFGYNIWYYIQ